MLGISRTVLVLGCLISCAVAGCGGGAGDPQFTIRRVRMVGEELRVILETSTTQRPLASHSSKTSNAKGWLITVDLSRGGPIESRARVIGPLWDFANERSPVTFEVGAAGGAPFFDLAWDGSVIRIRQERDGSDRGMVREHLALDATPFWKKDGSFLPLPSSGPPMNEETVVSFSGRYLLRLWAGTTTLHERLTGERIDDPWLEAAFKDCRSIERFKNVKTWLTDDLKYLVSSPDAIWNDGQGNTYETFDIRGKTYNRGDYGLVWRRPEPEPVVFKKDHSEATGSVDSIRQAISLEGRLYFLYCKGGAYAEDQEPSGTLVPFADGQRYQVAVPRERSEWGRVLPDGIQVLDSHTRIAFFATNDFMSPKARDRVHDEAVVVFVWDLKHAGMSVQDVLTGQLFEKRGGEYVPKRAAGVE